MTTASNLSDDSQRALAETSLSLIAGMTDAELRLFTDGTVAMLEAIKQEWDRRILAGSPAAGRA